MEGTVAIEIYDHCDCGEDLDLNKVKRVAELAHPLCLEQRVSEDVPLLSLLEIEFSLVSDEAIAKVHQEFMEDPTPTAVITFHHGEILIRPETAKKQAVEFGSSLQREVCLYAVHGLLHLAGHEDYQPEEAQEMKALQEKILSKVFGT